ncbi:MAG: transposase [Candidatus Aenigmarchaeota archaeon]|nr:transposase [Candidatus Aenigmarchaeota archaeon]
MDTKMLDLYTDHLMTCPRYATATGLSATLDNEIKHDKVTQFLASDDFNSQQLWLLVKPTLRKTENEDGVIIFDDTISKKPYTDENKIICWHFDHSKGISVKGINILTGLYHNDGATIPISYNIIEKPTEYTDPKTGKLKRKSEKTKNELFREMIVTSLGNTIKFKYVLADIWFCSSENIEFIKDNDKEFIMGIKSNRLTALSEQDKKEGKFLHLRDIAIEENTARKVYLKGVKFPVLVTKQVFTNKDESTGILYLVCSNLNLEASEINTIYQKRWKVEEYHKSIKSNTALEKSPTKTVRTQSNHIFASLYAFFKFERLRIKTNLNHFALKAKIYLKAAKAAFGELQELKLVHEIGGIA